MSDVPKIVAELYFITIAALCEIDNQKEYVESLKKSQEKAG